MPAPGMMPPMGMNQMGQPGGFGGPPMGGVPMGGQQNANPFGGSGF